MVPGLLSGYPGTASVLSGEEVRNGGPCFPSGSGRQGEVGGGDEPGLIQLGASAQYWRSSRREKPP